MQPGLGDPDTETAAWAQRDNTICLNKGLTVFCTEAATALAPKPSSCVSILAQVVLAHWGSAGTESCAFSAGLLLVSHCQLAQDADITASALTPDPGRTGPHRQTVISFTVM